MKIEEIKTGNKVTYKMIFSDNEYVFIDTLTEECRKNIYRGFATPEDYGYKPECVYFQIDGRQIEGIPTEREQFIKFFKELDTLIYSDDRKYWVLYDAVNPETPFFKEYFWCIPTSEINFRRDPEGGWILVGDVTLDEEEVGGLAPDEEYNLRDAVAEYNKKFELYERFEEAFAEYVLFDVQSDEHIFKIWKSLQEWVTVEDEDIAADNRVCLVTYLEEDWNAWFMSIVNQEYKYMNLTQTVWDSWLER